MRSNPERKTKSAEFFGAFLFAYAAEASRADFAMFNFAAPDFLLNKNNYLNFQIFLRLSFLCNSAFAAGKNLLFEPYSFQYFKIFSVGAGRFDLRKVCAFFRSFIIKFFRACAAILSLSAARAFPLFFIFSERGFCSVCKKNRLALIWARRFEEAKFLIENLSPFFSFDFPLGKFFAG